jgi:hypothetical protein
MIHRSARREGMDAMSNGDVSLKLANCRPERVDSFLIQGETYDEWFLANKTANRFFILNIGEVVQRINPQHTTYNRSDFDEAERMIDENVDIKWKDQYPFTYEASRTQLYPQVLHSAKRFGIAATLILAMDRTAQNNGLNINVYDYLRIVPAYYFVDGLTADRLAAIEQNHEIMTVDAKLAKFGEDFIDRSFEATCLLKMEQDLNLQLITELSQGGCVTKYIADYIIKFVHDNYPHQLHVGPVRAAGQPSSSYGLGVKNAVDKMRVPRKRKPEELAPLF